MSIDPRRGLSRLFDGGSVVANSERQLLDRFLASHDELAFEAIVAKHGPMVVGVCRSFLSNSTDVDDAFQATFLVLVKKASSLRDGDQLSPWLHGVARRVSLQARALAARRRDREPLAAGSEPFVPEATLRATEQRELAALIHAEIDRLSTPERSAITLCDLEGLTHQQAADQLGWPLGTVKARVSRGRDRLRNRLIRRGVTLPLGLLAATLAGESSASIAVPAALLATTTRAALALAASRVLSVGLISAPVFALTQGAVRAMIFTKLKAGAIALAATASVLAVPGVVAYQQSPRSEPSKTNQVARSDLKAQPSEILKSSDGQDTTVSNPSVLKLKIAEAVVKSIDATIRDRRPVPNDDFREIWYRRLAEAEFDKAVTKADRVQVVQSYVNRVEQMTLESSRKFDSKLAENNLLNDQEQQSANWNSIWNKAESLNEPLTKAKTWLAQVQAENIQGGSGNRQFVTKPMVTTTIPASGGVIGSSTPEPRRQRPRVKTMPNDEKKNQAILAKLEERISMNFPNETPIADVIKYIEQSTQDEHAGLPTGIPIYVDPKGLQDADKTFASTIAINLEGIPLRTTLLLLLDQIDLTYSVAGGLLLIEAQTEKPKPSFQ